MRTIPIVETLAGTTLRVTWVNSGVTPTVLYSELLNTSDSMVSSLSAVSSGGGFYYSVHPIPNSVQWLVNRWTAVVGANTYVNRQLIRARTLEVD